MHFGRYIATANERPPQHRLGSLSSNIETPRIADGKCHLSADRDLPARELPVPVQSRWTSDPEQACCGHGLDALDTCGEQVTQILWTGMG